MEGEWTVLTFLAETHEDVAKLVAEVRGREIPWTVDEVWTTVVREPVSGQLEVRLEYSTVSRDKWEDKEEREVLNYLLSQERFWELSAGAQEAPGVSHEDLLKLKTSRP